LAGWLPCGRGKGFAVEVGQGLQDFLLLDFVVTAESRHHINVEDGREEVDIFVAMDAFTDKEGACQVGKGFCRKFPEDNDVRWLEYCHCAATVGRQHVLECVLSDLDAEDSPMYEFIDDAISNPHEPGRPKANITDLARLGQAILHLIAKSVDDQVGLRMAVEVRHG
jgi:hypothetical protein